MENDTHNQPKILTMFKMKNIILIAFAFFSTLSFSQFTDVINSNRPGNSMGAFSVGETVFQTEFGMYGYDESHDLQNYDAQGIGADLSLRYGAFFEQLEFIVQLQYQYEWYQAALTDSNSSGLNQTIIGAKYLIYDPDKNYKKKINLYSWKANHKFNWREIIPAVGIYVGANIDGKNDKFPRPGIPSGLNVSPKVMLITQNQFGKWVLVTNFIADKFNSNLSSLEYIVTLTRGFNPKWSAFVENEGFYNDYYTDNLIRGGAAYLIKSNLQVDASVGTNFKNTPSMLFGGVGISWRFDKNYTTNYLRIPDTPEQKAAKKKAKKDAQKERAKKGKERIEAMEKKLE